MTGCRRVEHRKALVKSADRHVTAASTSRATIALPLYRKRGAEPAGVMRRDSLQLANGPGNAHVGEATEAGIIHIPAASRNLFDHA